MGLYLGGELHIPTDSFPEPDYRQVNSTELIRLAHNASWLSLDSEVLGLDPFNDEPFSLQVSFQEGTGYFIHADDTRSLLELSYIVEDIGEAFIHNSPFDLPVAERLGVEFDLDTVIVACRRWLCRELGPERKAVGT